MTVTATEFKANFGKYLKFVCEEDILITRNGKVIAQLSKPREGKIEAIRSLTGIAGCGQDVTTDEIRAERLKRQ